MEGAKSPDSSDEESVSMDLNLKNVVNNDRADADLDSGDESVYISDNEAEDVDLDEDNLYAEEEAEGFKGNKLVWRNDERPLESDEELELSPGCYDMLHRITLDWSCLSFDILKDDMGACRVNYPLECYVVSGTQPGTKPGLDSLIHVMKWSNLTQNFGDYQEEDEGEEEGLLRVSSFKHKGIVNRVKSCPQSARLVCSMADTSLVHIWDIKEALEDLETNKEAVKMGSATPLMTCDLHKSEGYALAWSNLSTGKLATGSCDGSLVLWKPVQGGWELEKVMGIDTSIEDLKWSLEDGNLLLAGCCDGTVKLFDLREPRVSSEIKVSDSDVNSISLNSLDKHLLLSGAEDGSVRIYDLRYPQVYLSNLKWHNKAITSVDWHPLDSAVCLASCRDDSISIWDVSIEAEGVARSDLPQQLLFLHMGQSEITEALFHRNLPGVIISTALDGFNVFKTINMV